MFRFARLLGFRAFIGSSGFGVRGLARLGRVKGGVMT